MNILARFIVGAVTSGIAAAQFCEHQWEGKFANHEVDGVPYLQARQDAEPPPLEIRSLIVNGPSSNRVDLIFFSDGCMYEMGGRRVMYAAADPNTGYR